MLPSVTLLFRDNTRHGGLETLQIGGLGMAYGIGASESQTGGWGLAFAFFFTMLS